ncbi:hypothetical protein LCGC14_0895970 [marine sediment metagenome]|uniref:Uncharacterized protein n=1 Tax=marine sediment metagenome TaxID=412755 RepID=A0A0F9S4U0_9ZZZZ
MTTFQIVMAIIAAALAIALVSLCGYDDGKKG